MLSIIISSYQPDYFVSLRKNIEETCGVPYEIIKIDNPGLMGICQAYNKGAAMAKYDNLLFIHEDVVFENRNWGTVLIDKYFTLENVGILGLAGATRRFHLPYGWGYPLNDEKFVFVNHLNETISPQTHPPSPIKIKVIDGVFLGMKKEVWKSLKFDEKINGFHFYDIDISLRAIEKYCNYLISEIDFFHYSIGNYDNDWVRLALQFNHRKNYDFDICTPAELASIRIMWYIRLTFKKINFINRIKYFFKMGVDSQSSKTAFYFLFPIVRRIANKISKMVKQ